MLKRVNKKSAVKTCPKCKAGNLLRHGAKGPSAEGKKESTRRRRSANRAPPSDTAKVYTMYPAPGETVGAGLSGSGKTAWVSERACIKVAIKRGHKPGTTLRYIQKAGNKCYLVLRRWQLQWSCRQTELAPRQNPSDLSPRVKSRQEQEQASD